MPSYIEYESTPGVRITLEDGAIIDAGHRDLFISGPPGRSGNLTADGHVQVKFNRLPIDAQRALRDALTRSVLEREPDSPRDQAILAIQKAMPRA